MGRPSLYSEQMADEICERCLTRPIHQVAADTDMPSESAIYVWFKQYPAFLEKYTRACEIRAYRRSDEIDRITQDVRDGRLEPDQARVMIDAHKWQAGKENRKAFGDKVDVNAAGRVTVELVNFAPDADRSDT